MPWPQESGLQTARPVVPSTERRVGRDGAAATLSAHTGAPGFGKRERDRQAGIAKELKRRRVVALCDGALEPVATDAVVLQDWPSQLAVLKSDAQALKACDREEQHLAASVVKDWREGPGIAARDALVAKAPAIAASVSGLTNEGAKMKEKLFLWDRPLDIEVPRFAGFIQQTSTTLALACNRDWQLLHRMVVHTDQGIPEVPKRKSNEKPSCLEADGVCFCGPIGDSKWAFKLWLCSTMKVAISSAENKALLSDANVVIRIRSSYNDSKEELPDEDREEVDVWYHVTDLLWSPYRPSFRLLSWPNDYRDADGHYHLFGAHVYYGLFAMVDATYQEDSEWSARFYELVNDQRPIETIDATHILVRRMDVDVPRPFAPRKPRARKPKEVRDPLLDAVHDLCREDSHDGSGEEETENEVDIDRDEESEPDSKPREVVCPVEPDPPHESDVDEVRKQDPDEVLDLFFSDHGSSSSSNKKSPGSTTSDSDSSGEEDGKLLVVSCKYVCMLCQTVC